jgi:hypothetical protein
MAQHPSRSILQKNKRHLNPLKSIYTAVLESSSLPSVKSFTSVFFDTRQKSFLTGGKQKTLGKTISNRKTIKIKVVGLKKL